MAKRRRPFALVAACLFGAAILATPAMAASPDAYVTELPSTDKVIAKIKGSDTSDTAARQYTVFNWLESVVLEEMGDRYVQGKMTAAEKALRDGYHDNYGRIQREVLAALPESERPSRPDTQYGKWQALVNTYYASAAFRTTFETTLFSASFRASYDRIHKVAMSQEPWFGFTDPPPPPPPGRDWTLAYVGLGIVVILVGASGGGRLYGRRRGD